MKIPLLRPAPPPLSLAVAELKALEQSGIFSNFGPVNTLFEQEMLARFFGGEGACTTVCNATIGLMLAIKEAVGDTAPGQYALMPSFTFAATAQAALWCGLTPLLCDIHPANWAADPAAESELLTRYAGKIAVVIPYATFGIADDRESRRQRRTLRASFRTARRYAPAPGRRGSRRWPPARHMGDRSRPG